MDAFGRAGELARKKVYRDSLKRMQRGAAETREALGMIGADERMIRAADLRLMELNNEISKLNGEIFALEQMLGIAREGESAGSDTGAG